MFLTFPDLISFLGIKAQDQSGKESRFTVCCLSVVLSHESAYLSSWSLSFVQPSTVSFSALGKGAWQVVERVGSEWPACLMRWYK